VLSARPSVLDTVASRPSRTQPRSFRSCELSNPDVSS
jgi:hypothetical protein